jgi:hypothetical protein
LMDRRLSTGTNQNSYLWPTRPQAPTAYAIRVLK